VKSHLVLSLALFLVMTAPAVAQGQAGSPDQSTPSSCDLASASPWISRWFEAWELTSREILHIPDAPPPNIVFYDSACVYTTSGATAPGASVADGPALLGVTLPWRAAAHGDTLTLPNSMKVPVQLMTFANTDKRTGPFFVMAAPSYWAQKGHGGEPGLTAVFLHEFAHTRQILGMASFIGALEAEWKFPEELGDDVVQARFGSDSAYVAAYMAERDLLYRAAAADSLAEVRRMAAEALGMMRSRHARWFTGENAVFAGVDATFLSLEGSGQWVGYAWLAHPKGGGLSPDAAVRKMLGKRRWWSQDEGLGLFLVVDRLLPGWPSVVFQEHSVRADELLAQAIER
jgi:hypothetical protein